MRYLLTLLIIFLILGIIFKFLGFVLLFILRFWYIALPLVAYLYFSRGSRVKVVKENREEKLDPNKEVKLDKEPEVEDE